MTTIIFSLVSNISKNESKKVDVSGLNFGPNTSYTIFR